MNTIELAAKLREIGDRARYSTEPGRLVQEGFHALADSMDPPEQDPAEGSAAAAA